MTTEQPPGPCPDPWCEGAFGHAQCVADRWSWAMRNAGVSMADFQPVDLPGQSLSDLDPEEPR